MFFYVILKQINRYKVTYIIDADGVHKSTLRVPEPRFNDTGNYTCHRADAHHLSANQYVFVSGIKIVLSISIPLY